MDGFRTLAVALAAENDDNASPFFPVLYTGEFEHSGRKFTVTEGDLDKAIENFTAQVALGTELSTDFEHGQAEDGKASGWFKALKREGNRLLARVAWTPEARRQLEEGSRRYFSPEFTPSAKDEHGTPIGFKLLAGARVRRPHLRGLGPVALTEDARNALAQDAAEITSFVGPFTYSQAGPNYSITWSSTYSTASPTPTPKDARDMADNVSKDVETLTEKLSEATDQITALSERVTAAEERATEAETKHDTVVKELAEERLSAVLTQARREGRIDAKDETTAEFAELHEKVGLEGVRMILAKIPAETIPMSESGHGNDKPLDTSDAPEGVDPNSHRAAKLAEQYESEGMSADEAASKAYKEVYA